MLSRAYEPSLSNLEVEEALRATNRSCQVLRSIKEGGQGSVFDAVIDGTRVALKVYAADYVEHRAKREVDAMIMLNSPYVAKYFDHGFVEVRGQKCFYSANIFIEGEDLEDKIKRETLTVLQTQNLVIDMANAIDEMWGYRIVHCDISPKNIMLNSSGQFILIDLGIAKHLTAGNTSKVNCVWGTLGYLAPEQQRGRKNLTLRVDLFALGIVAYEAVTGEHPFNRNQSLVGVITPNPISSYVPAAAPLEMVINELLEPNPIRRPRSGRDIIKALKGVY